MTTFEELRHRLSLPVIAAPMFLVSNPAVALAACREGIVGTFPAHTARNTDILAEWLRTMEDGMRRLEDEGARPAPFAVNLVVHRSNPRLAGDLELVIRHRVPIVLTSKGAPGDVFARVHEYGGFIMHDVASRRHA